jgi:hypothetical protein
MKKFILFILVSVGFCVASTVNETNETTQFDEVENITTVEPSILETDDETDGTFNITNTTDAPYEPTETPNMTSAPEHNITNTPKVIVEYRNKSDLLVGLAFGFTLTLSALALCLGLWNKKFKFFECGLWKKEPPKSLPPDLTDLDNV